MDNMLCGEPIALVIFALPVSQPCSMRHSGQKLAPAAWIAPSTPPPPSSEQFCGVHDRVNALLGYIAGNSFAVFP